MSDDVGLHPSLRAETRRREQQPKTARLDAAIAANLKELGFWEIEP